MKQRFEAEDKEMYVPLSRRRNPPESPNEFLTDRTTEPFKHQILSIIHEYYWSDHHNGIAEHSPTIMMEFYKSRSDFHLPVDGVFLKEAVYCELEESKNMEFFDLLDCMLWCLCPTNTQIHNRKMYGMKTMFPSTDYYSMVDQMNESMQLHGIGYRIENGQLIDCNEPKVYEEVTEPFLKTLRKNGFVDADEYIRDAFEAYKNRQYEDAITNAAKCLENVVANLLIDNGIAFKEGDRFQNKVQLLIDSIDLPNAFKKEHMGNLIKIMEAPLSFRNEKGAHGNNGKDATATMVKYTLDTVCADVLLLIRLKCDDE